MAGRSADEQGLGLASLWQVIISALDTSTMYIFHNIVYVR